LSFIPINYFIPLNLQWYTKEYHLIIKGNGTSILSISKIENKIIKKNIRTKFSRQC